MEEFGENKFGEVTGVAVANGVGRLRLRFCIWGSYLYPGS